MRASHLRRVAGLAFALVVVVGACGGGGAANANDPAGSVNAALAAANGGNVAKFTEFACAAHKGDIAKAFAGADLSAAQAAGVNTNDILNAITLSFANVTTKEVSKTDTAATVHVTADMTLNFDKDKMKAVIKTMLAAQGAPTDDATINTALAAMSASLTTTQKLDEDVAVVNEGGKWLICS
jgi:hypothetical protein